MAENAVSEWKDKGIFKKKNKVTIKIFSERVDAERNTDLITSSLFSQIFQSTQRSSMYFSLFAKSHFPVGFPAYTWRKNWISFFFKSRGETCNFRPGSERHWTVKRSLSDPVLGSKRQEKPGWIEKRYPEQSKHSFFYFYFFFKAQLGRERQVFLGHTKSYLKASGACISWNCLFE